MEHMIDNTSFAHIVHLVASLTIILLMHPLLPVQIQRKKN
jgi:hypothetical protein